LDELLLDSKLLEQALKTCAKRAGATVVQTYIHHFNPIGLSGVLIIAESHIAIHTWPEENYASFDIYTCGCPDIAKRICTEITQIFKPKRTSSHSRERHPPTKCSAEPN